MTSQTISRTNWSSMSEILFRLVFWRSRVVKLTKSLPRVTRIRAGKKLLLDRVLTNERELNRTWSSESVINETIFDTNSSRYSRFKISLAICLSYYCIALFRASVMFINKALLSVVFVIMKDLIMRACWEGNYSSKHESWCMKSAMWKSGLLLNVLRKFVKMQSSALARGCRSTNKA